jgi:hypothetical protein
MDPLGLVVIKLGNDVTDRLPSGIGNVVFGGIGLGQRVALPEPADASPAETATSMATTRAATRHLAKVCHSLLLTILFGAID